MKPQKTHPCASFDVFCVKIGAVVLAVGDLEYWVPKNPAECTAESRMRRNKTTYPIWIKFFTLVGIADLIT